MKKFSILLLIMAAIAMCACEKQLKSDIPSEGSYVFTLRADASSIQTKTDYTDAGVFSWLSGDCISVLFNNGTTEKFFTLSTTDSGASATFSGTIDESYSIGSISGDKWALYPASDNHTFNGTVPSFNIPNEIDYTGEGKFYYANIPLYALGDGDNSFVFKQLSPVFRFTFTGIPNDVTKVKLVVDNDGHQMAGNIVLKDDSDSSINGYYLQYSNSGSPKTVSYTCNVKSDHSAVFYVPIRWWGTFKPTLTLYNASDNTVLITKTAQKATPDNNYARVKRITIPVTGGVWSYQPKFNVWEGAASTVGHTHSSGTHITSLKACADASYIYLYLEMNEAFFPLTSSSATESLLQFAIKDDNGSADWKFGSDKINLTWLCWLASNGSFSISAKDGCALFNDAKIETHGGVVYAEIQIKRSEISQIQSSTTATTGVGVCIFPGWNNNAENWNGYTWAPDGSLLNISLPAYSAL